MLGSINMSEKNRGSIIQTVIAFFFFVGGLGAFLSSFFGGLLLTLGGLLLFPKINDIVLDKFSFLSKGILLVASIILIILGSMVSGSARKSKQAEYLRENPEVAKRLEQEKIMKEDEANNRKFERLLIDKCRTPLFKMLKDPSSLEIDRSSENWTKLDDGHVIEFSYTAKNSFNAKTRGKIRCEFDNFANLTDVSDGSKSYIPKKPQFSASLNSATKQMISDVHTKSSKCKSDALLQNKQDAKKCGLELFEFLKEGSEYMTVTRDLLKKTENDSQLEQSPEYKAVLQEINETIENTNFLVNYLK